MSSKSFKSLKEFKSLSNKKDGEINEEINEGLINNRKEYIKKTLEILNNIFKHNIKEHLEYISTLNNPIFNEIYDNFIKIIKIYINENNHHKGDNIQNIRFSDVLYTNLQNIKDENDENKSIKENLETLFIKIKDLIIFKENKDKLNSS